MDKSRYWFVTIQVANMMKAGLTNEQMNDYDYVAEFFLNLWQSSSPTRTGCVSVCVSADGLYHLHAALYGEKTTLTSVARLMFGAHVEPCRGGKDNLMKYILKEEQYAEAGESVLHVVGRDNIMVHKGKRTDLQEIEELILQGLTPREIMGMKLSYCRYEKEIKSSYLIKRIREAPLRKKMYVEWHVGESGTGKSYCYDVLCATYDSDDIYFAGYSTNGWLDRYMEAGAPRILFMDELKGTGSWQELLNVLDVYTQRTIHCRYGDAYPLWDIVHITSVYPPEEIYQQMVKVEHRTNDSLKQLLRRLTKITYHFIHNGLYMQYSIPASSYTNYGDLKRDAYNSLNSAVGGKNNVGI